MSGAGDHLRSIIVLGNGIAGYAAAIALARALPRAEIRLVLLPPDPESWIDRIGAASNAIHRFHQQIGLDPRLFVQEARAEPVHLRRYRQRDGSTAREASTDSIAFVEGVPLHHIWMRHRRTQNGAGPDFAAMLLALREARSDTGGFGVRYDAAAYHALLARMATALPIAIVPVDAIEVIAAAGRIEAIEGDASGPMRADLFVDAAGPVSHLLDAAGVEREDWSPWLPPRALEDIGPGAGEPGEETLTFETGAADWQTRRWRIRASVSSGAARPGHYRSCWAGNAVAIGEAAAFAPTLDGTGLGLALEDIMRLIALLPRPGSSGTDKSEYDRRTAIAHQALANWSSLSFADADTVPPPPLTPILDAFAQRSRIAVDELDPIPPGAWLARLMALGPQPQRIDPTALALPEAVVAATMTRAGGPSQ